MIGVRAEAINRKVLLCVLFRTDAPFIIRPKRSGYIPIGESYVYDIMEGEVIQVLDQPVEVLKETWIELV